MTFHSRVEHVALTGLTAILLCSCQTGHPLAPTPNLYATRHTSFPNATLHAHQKRTRAQLFYITDRLPLQSPPSAITYQAKRSASMAFGAITVRFGHQLNWNELVELSNQSERPKAIDVSIEQTEEKTRFPETPLAFTVVDGTPTVVLSALQDYKNARNSMKETLEKRLEQSPRQEVLLFVHGFNNDFELAGLALADLWHFTGRQTTPLFYSWPAASGGLFGYFTDRESGEFTLYHLKETLRLISSIESLEKIHIIAHSRGTDLITTALRELIIETRARGEKPLETLKVANLILAAPDLDFGVVRQRLIAEQFGPAIGQITVYMNRKDKALGLSQFMMSGLRFGKITSEDLEPTERHIFEQIKNVNFINVEGVNSFIGHAYYRKHPGVLSDIALILQTNARPGTPKRPLKHESGNFWSLPDNYPLEP